MANPVETTSYVVEATNQYGCISMDSVTINIIDGITIVDLNDTSICIGETVNIIPEVLLSSSIGDPVTYNWLPTGDFIGSDNPNQNITPELTTTYTLIVSAGECKADTQQITITTNTLPQPDLGPDQHVFSETPITLNANAGNNIMIYDWSPFDGLNCYTCEVVNLIASVSISYRVDVTDYNGCVGSDSIIINVANSCADDIFVPNSFSPNRDGHNDEFFVRGKHLSGIKVFRIFDRWGALVYESNDMMKGWNGIHKSQYVDPGVFIYYIEAICDNGGVVRKKGNVTVLR